VRLGQGPLPAGRYVVHMRAEAESAGPFRLTVSGDGDASSPPSPSETAEIGAGGAAEIAARVAHPGGAFVLRARLARAATNAGAATEPGLAGSVWVTGARIERLD
jgi:hypothetical protein